MRHLGEASGGTGLPRTFPSTVMTPKRTHITCRRRSIELYLMDCIEGLGNPQIAPPGSVDVVVTSPPYNIGVRYARYNDAISREEYLNWLDRWAARVKMVMSERASLFLNVGSKPRDPTVPFEVLGVMLRHFRLQNTIHWVKSIAIEKEHAGKRSGIARDLVVGHYKPINSGRFLNDNHEYIFHLTKYGDVPVDRLAIGVAYQDKSNVTRWKKAAGDLHCRGNVWFIPYRTISDRMKHRPHPATFPPKLPEMCLRLHGLERIRRVLDPFLGLGNTALACCALGLDFIGFEIDPDYYAHAVRVVRERCGAA